MYLRKGVEWRTRDGWVVFLDFSEAHTVESQIIEISAMSLKLPPGVRFGVSFLFFVSEGLRRSLIASSFPLFPSQGILDYRTVHGSWFKYSRFYGICK